MENALSEQKCPACGAPLRFDPLSGKSVCDWCGSSFDIPEGEAPEQIVTDRPGVSETELPLYNCRSCGAEIIADAVSASVTCPYCGNNIVLTEKVSGGLRPDGIIPFRFDKKQLPDEIRKFYKDKKLLPRNFFAESSLTEVCGVYVPFWLYSCEFSGEVKYEGYKDRSTRSGDYLITERRFYDVVRDVSMRFADIPVDASERLEDDLMDSVEPFYLSDLKPFNMSYLSGFFAERFDRDSDAVRSRAEKRMNTSAYSIVDSRVGGGYSGVSRRSSGMKARGLTAKYVLLPVYTFGVKWDGRTYRFAMNGQTGKVVGDIPTSKKKSMLIRWLTFAGLFAAMMLLLSFISC